ncbi:MAG: ABC transporter permease subunit [Phycisphaerales bacterium]|nr:ABC transporter permease subunit [Phycisphaerales bacterium]
MSDAAAPKSPATRRTLPSAGGEPMIWLTGGALVLCILMILGLVSLVLYNGSRAFWPGPIAQVELNDGTAFLGIRTDREEGTATTEPRALYRVGNRDIGQESFRWVDDAEVREVSYPPDAVMLERLAWGVWFGIPESITAKDEDGSESVLASGMDEVLEQYESLHRDARGEYHDAQTLRDHTLGEINHKIDSIRLRVREKELEFATAEDRPGRLPILVWVLAVAGCVLGGAGFVLLGRRANAYEIGVPGGIRIGRFGTAAMCVVLLLAGWIGAPWRGGAISETELQSYRADAELRERDLLSEYDRVLADIQAIEREDSRVRFVVNEVTGGRFSPISQTENTEPMRLSQVVRMVPANRLSTGQRFGVYLSRWWEYLTTGPREANTEGGVFPVIVGTVLLTLMLTIFVTPLGVIAALYLREYAVQGVLTSLIRIAVNNLAGVPSIVYGVFGLGFFCYTLGRYIDTGVARTVALPPLGWWFLYLAAAVVGVAAFALGVWSKPKPGEPPRAFNVWMKRLAWGAWVLTGVLVVLVFVRTPYFDGFFAARAADGSPTFGARGLLWASLTLALLTLPVVIVATEEAIAAVPNSMREGSYGCGASKWQTMRRVVLPGAMPGILTGAILAMARGAGEVAPLMLVGAVKLNQDLPISANAPFLHADRSFMHLGFHIYDLGFQSPDSEAARPLVWTTVLLFLTLVLALNLIAIVLRARLRARMTRGAV